MNIQATIEKEKGWWYADEQHVTSKNAKSQRCFALWRLWFAIGCTVQIIAVMIGVEGPGNFFKYLTNWGTVIAAGTFWLLFYEHYRLGHYVKEKKPTENPETDNGDVNTKCSKKSLWKFSVYAYEGLAVVLITITLGYWIFVFPHIGEYWIDPIAENILAN